MNDIDIKQLLIAAGIGALTSLLMGKAIRRLALLPFEWLSRKTNTKIDDKLIEEARHDLGVDSPTIQEDNKKEEK